MTEFKQKTQDFIDYQKTKEGKIEIINDWQKIKSGYFSKSYLHLEWIVLRILYSMNLKRFQIKSYIQLDEHFKPKHHAASNKPDICILNQKKSYVIEITERPISGKIEHYSHIDFTLKEHKVDSCIGVLLTIPSTSKIHAWVWNDYHDYYIRYRKLFMTFSIEFLINLLKNKEDPSDFFHHYLEESENIWSTSKSWKEIKKSIISLESKISKKNFID